MLYADEDGCATKASQAAYDARMRILLFTTVSLSGLGFGIAVLNIGFTGEILQSVLSLKQYDLLGWGILLWESSLPIQNIITATNLDS